MEKFSAYRDPGTGIQPFLKPVPPVESDLFAKITLPLRYLIATIRTALILLLLFIYLALVSGLCFIFSPIPPLRRVVSHAITAIIARATLLFLGFFWIPVEQVRRKRGKTPNRTDTWKPRAGDLIISNWVSWIELLWLAFRFNPIFILPVSEIAPIPTSSSQNSKPITYTPGRRTGTGSADIQSPRKAASPPVPILGFRRVSLLSIIRLTGQIPPFGYPASGSSSKLEELQKTADRPIVVFPECTTSNGRGLLRFVKLFHRNVPVSDCQVFVMCVRYDPPTILAPTLTWSIPSSSLNPLAHIFATTTSLTLPTISIRLLAPSESPSSLLFTPSEIITDPRDNDDQLTGVCSTLIAQLGKMKILGMGWEDKANFLDFYRGRQK